jgi:hypothetical protein
MRKTWLVLAACTLGISSPAFARQAEWHGAGACQTWMNDYDANAKKNGITDGLVTLGKPSHVDVTGDRAYVVIPSTYTWKQRGVAMREDGSAFTFALHKDMTGWRFVGWSWAKK